MVKNILMSGDKRMNMAQIIMYSQYVLTNKKERYIKYSNSHGCLNAEIILSFLWLLSVVKNKYPGNKTTDRTIARGK